MSNSHRNRNNQALDEILTVDEVASYLKVSPVWVYQKVRRLEIPFYRIGRRLRFRKSTIDLWLKKYEVGSEKGGDGDQ